MTGTSHRSWPMLLIVFLAFSPPVFAQSGQPPHEGHPPQPAMQPPQGEQPITTLPNLSEREGWPEPVADRTRFSFLLFDNLEYHRGSAPGALRWDVLSWYGGDVHRVWLKTEGTGDFREGAEREADAQVLYGKLLSPFFDLQMGMRVARVWGEGPAATRVQAVIGLQGLAPYRYEIEPALFVGTDGKVSGRFTSTADVLLTQRLILQPRFETNFAAQRDEAFGLGSGINDIELGVRLRFEIRREFPPYIGITWKRSVGSTRALVTAGGEDASQLAIVAGIRMWR